MKFLGIELHSSCFSCCFLHEDGTKYKTGFGFSAGSLKAFYQYLDAETYVKEPWHG